VERSCLCIDLRLSILPCRTTGVVCERMKPSITVRVRRIEEEEAMSVSEAVRGVVDESAASTEFT